MAIEWPSNYLKADVTLNIATEKINNKIHQFHDVPCKLLTFKQHVWYHLSLEVNLTIKCTDLMERKVDIL